MAQIPTPFGTIAGKYPFMGSAGLVNCYAEVQSENGKARLVIVPSEGMVTFSSVTDTPCRGAIFLEDLDLAYSFHEASSYKVNSAGTATLVGTIPGYQDVDLTRNKKATPQITVLVNETGELFYIESDVIRRIEDEDLPTDIDIVAISTLGEFTLVGYESGAVYWSTQGETSAYDGANFFTAEQSADRLVGMAVDGNDVLLFSEFTTEWWVLTGNNPDQPFEYRTAILRGSLSKKTIKRCDGGIFFAGQSREGEKGVYRVSGYNAIKISTNEIDRLIEAETDPSAIVATAYGRAGHAFYSITGTDWTRTYDASTQQWHTRKSYGLDVWRADHSFAAWNKVIVGDRETGNLFYLADDTFTENSGVMVMEITSPFLHAFPNGGVVDRASFDLLVGQGVTSPTAQGYEPLVMISKSVDGGNTWSFPRQIALGKAGKYLTRINTWRWGRFGPKGIAYRISISDPVGRGLALMDASIRRIAA